MKESQVRAMCKKCGFSTDKRFTRFKNKKGEPWLHIEDTKGYGFIEWYDMHDGYTVFATYEVVTAPYVAEVAEFYTNASDLINLLTANGVTQYNIEEG